VKITAKTDTYVSTPWGAAITIAAGEEMEVGDDLGYECIQAGCTEIKDVTPEPKPEPEPEPKPKKAALKKKEADS